MTHLFVLCVLLSVRLYQVIDFEFLNASTTQNH